MGNVLHLPIIPPVPESGERLRPRVESIPRTDKGQRALLEFGRRAFPVDEFEDTPRPKTRGDCIGGERPCPYSGCRHHLGIEVTRTGSMRHVGELDEMPDTCSLDVSDRGSHTLEEVAETMGVVRERVRQIEDKALRKLARLDAIRRLR